MPLSKTNFKSFNLGKLRLSSLMLLENGNDDLLINIERTILRKTVKWHDHKIDIPNCECRYNISVEQLLEICKTEYDKYPHKLLIGNELDIYLKECKNNNDNTNDIPDGYKYFKDASDLFIMPTNDMPTNNMPINNMPINNMPELKGYQPEAYKQLIHYYKLSDTKLSDTISSDTISSDTRLSDTRLSDTKSSDTKSHSTKVQLNIMCGYDRYNTRFFVQLF